jgi:hypothetical protein
MEVFWIVPHEVSGFVREDVTCACAANDAVVYDGAAVDRDLQAVMCVVVLGRLIIGVELRQRDKRVDR